MRDGEIEMIDIEELRKVIADCYWPTAPVAINKLLDRLEEAEKERDNANAAAAGIALHAEAMQARLEIVEKERDALQAKIAEMEQQEPVAWIVRGGYPVPLENLEWQLLCGAERPTLSWTNQEMRPLYALPGAKGEEK